MAPGDIFVQLSFGLALRAADAGKRQRYDDANMPMILLEAFRFADLREKSRPNPHLRGSQIFLKRASIGPWRQLEPSQRS